MVLAQEQTITFGLLLFWSYIRTSSWLRNNRSLQNFLDKFQVTPHSCAHQFSGQQLFVSSQAAFPFWWWHTILFLDNGSNPSVLVWGANQGALPFKHMTQMRSTRHSSWNSCVYHHLETRNSSPAETRFYSSLHPWCLAQCLAMNIQHMRVE